MRTNAPVCKTPQIPALHQQAEELAAYLSTLPPSQLQTAMNISAKVAATTHQLFADWQPRPTHSYAAIDAFLGDIYSGLQVRSLSQADRRYANDHLFILSGLYGVLRALDSIQAYRLEMGYRLPDAPYHSLYHFWGDRIARQLPANRTILNLSAVEYTRVVFPHLTKASIVTPRFLTISPKTGKPIFVTVHAKIARGAFAHWVITQRVEDTSRLTEFTELGYRFDSLLSTSDQPVFVCQTFGGIGMSVRLS